MPLRLTASYNESVKQTRSINLLRIQRIELFEARDENDLVVADASWAKLTMEVSINDDEDSWEIYKEPYYIRNVKTSGEEVTINGQSYTLIEGDHFSIAVGGTPDGVMNRREDLKTALYAAWEAMGYNAGSVE